ncbi:MAG: response regulator [Actinomycetota bacterium]
MPWGKRLRAALDSERSSEPLLEVIDNLPDAVTLSEAVRDGDGHSIDMRLLYMNRQARAGQPDPEAALGRLASELWPDMVSNGSLQACMRVLDTGIPESGHFEWTDAASYRPAGYEWRAVRVGDDVLLWVLRDVSERLRHQQDTTVVYERVVQSLTAAKMARELGNEAAEAEGITAALDAAKMVVTRELTPLAGQAGAPLGAGAEVRAPVTREVMTGGIRTVVCDDDVLVRKMVCRMLSSNERFAIVGEAANGEEVVAVAQEQQPDLVLIDLNMPVMSGMEAIPLVRAAAPDAVIVALSGLEAEAAEAPALSAGASAYIEKGTSLASIRERLERLFP